MPRMTRLKGSKAARWPGLLLYLGCGLALGIAHPGRLEARGRDRFDVAALRRDDQAVLTIGYRLATSAVAFCPEPVPTIGLELHDLAEYSADYRVAAAASFGLGRLPAVLAVAQGGPAAQAGVEDDDDVVAVDGLPVPDEGGFARVQEVLRRIDEEAGQGPVELTLRRGGRDITARVKPVPACPTRFQTNPSADKQALADGRLVEITTGLVDFTRGPDELAGVLAHELAHNILHHRDRLKAAGVSHGLLRNVGRGARLTRRTEDEADRLSVYLVDRAGYAPAAILTFWRRFQHKDGLFASATHAPDSARIATIEAEIRRLEAIKKQGGDPRPAFLEGTALPALE